MSFKDSVENCFNKLLGKLGYKVIKIDAGMLPPQASPFQDNASVGVLHDINAGLAFIKEGSVILDIGANIGNHTVFWSLFSPAAKIISFEPQQLVFNILKRNFR